MTDNTLDVKTMRTIVKRLREHAAGRGLASDGRLMLEAAICLDRLTSELERTREALAEERAACLAIATEHSSPPFGHSDPEYRRAWHDGERSAATEIAEEIQNRSILNQIGDLMTTKDDVERAALIERLLDRDAMVAGGLGYAIPVMREAADALALPPQSVMESMVEAASNVMVDLSRRDIRVLLQAALSALPAGRLPQDVIDLVIAARNVAFDTSGPTSEYLAALDRASEAFADRVPWDDVPEEDELTAAVPAGGDGPKQPSSARPEHGPSEPSDGELRENR